MTVHLTKDVQNEVQRSLFESSVFNLTGIRTEPLIDSALVKTQNFDGTKVHNSRLNYTGDDLAFDNNLGGMQPGHLFQSEDSEPSDKGVKYEFSLSNPFRLGVHGLAFPLVGPLSFIVEKSKNVSVAVFSLLYMALPTLNWFLGAPNRVMFRTTYNNYRPLTERSFVRRCESCNCWTNDCMMSPQELATYPHMQCPCERAKAPSKLEQGAMRLSESMLYVNTLTYQNFDDIASLLTIHRECDHPLLPYSPLTDFALPRPTLDGLYLHGPFEQWRARQHEGNLRCFVHYPTTIHSLHPEFINKAIVRPTKAGNSKYFAQITRILFEWQSFVDCYEEQDVVYILALSIDRLPKVRFNDLPTIVIYCEIDLPRLFLEKFPAAQGLYRFFRVPSLGFSLRHLPNWRVVLALWNASPCRMVLINQEYMVRERVVVERLLNTEYQIVSSAIGSTWPFYAGSAVIRGRSNLASWAVTITSFYWGNMIYGWDEVFPAYHEKPLIAVYKGLASPYVMCGNTGYSVRGPKVALMISAGLDDENHIFVGHWSREFVYWANRAAGMDVDPGRLSFWHVWADSRPTFRVENIQDSGYEQFEPSTEIDENFGTSKSQHSLWHFYKQYKSSDVIPRPNPIVAPGENILQELVASLGGVRMFTLGTRGDVMPFRALAIHLASYRVPVSLIMLNDTDEGKVLLDTALNRRSDNEAVLIFNRARTMALENLTGASLCHSSLMIGEVPALTLTPPRDHIYTSTVGGSWITSLGSAVLGVWIEDSAVIGPYTGPRVLPMSVDGFTFLKSRQNTREIPIGAYWGSDGVPAPGFEHVPLVPNGDHQEIFSKYINIVCHGGAGTVSCASAAGARVIVPRGGLDRSRRMPYDAGVGLVPGADPDNIFLVLADQDIRFLAFWLRANWLKPWKLWMFYGYQQIGWLIFRGTMLYILYNKAFRQVDVSTEPWIVLYGVLGGTTPSLLIFLVLLVAAKSIDALLSFLNISKLRIISSFFSYNWKLSISPVALYLASKYTIAHGMIYTICTPVIYSVMVRFLQTAMNHFLGFAAHIDDSGENIPTFSFEFSLRWWHCFPIIHTALICKDLQLRFEGKEVAGLYSLQFCDFYESSPSIVLPTQLTLQDIKSVSTLTGKYSLAWNCQTILLQSFKHKFISLGLGSIPLYATTAAVGVVYSCNAIVLTLIWAIAQLIPRVEQTLPGDMTAHFALGGDALTLLWAKLSHVGHWDPNVILNWWRMLYLPF